MSHDQQHPIILTDVFEGLTAGEGRRGPEDLHATDWPPGHLLT